MIRRAATGASIFGLYLLFAGQVSATEIGAGLGVAGLVLIATQTALRAADRQFDFGWSDLKVVAASFAGLPFATWRTGLALLRALPGGELTVKIREEGFAGGPEGAARARARRAATLFNRSLAPDGFVLRMPPGRGRITVHALRPESERR